MILQASFVESDQGFTAKMDSEEQTFEAEFSGLVVVERSDIPPQYGLVTYDNNRTITVT